MYIGIDAGSKFIKISYTDENKKIIPYAYCQHYGDPGKEISRLLSGRELSRIEKIVFSGSHADQLSQIYKVSESIDDITAIIDAINYSNIKCGYIINVGAGSIKLIKLNDCNQFLSYSENTLCAAGTGSFLDEQMHRMNFTYDDIKDIPFIKNPPDVATRCAVFAKSDLIHRQQEGYSKEEMWSGLCKGVAMTMLQSIFRGDIPKEKILFCGGLFLNPIVRTWINGMVQDPAFLDTGHFLASIGSIVNGKAAKIKQFAPAAIKPENNDLKILELKYSRPVDFSAKKEYLSNGIEVRIHAEIPNEMDIAIGIDIGSTSTKLVIIDVKGSEALIDIYGKTRGNPVEATKQLFDELKNIFIGKKIHITHAATTGSGRKLIGKIIGADLITNEITAHFKGATHFDPAIETIFEIGGQDSKYIRGQNGNVVDCNMNFVCAAGTGSFIEEQADRLGFDIRDLGDIVLGLKTPPTSDRCTVFMEQDINKLLTQGFSREEVLAGVIRSISKNYLNRVVGSRPVTGNKIFFQGATARNKGIVAAFESLLQKEIIVSPLCHVMGAYGAAILSLERNSDSHFRGLDVFDQKIEFEYKKCDKCANLCKITEITFNTGIKESWGFMCGKESIEENRNYLSRDNFKKIYSMANFEKKSRHTGKPWIHQKTIGIPNVLSMINHKPLWKTFLEELGFRVVFSGTSTQEIKKLGISISKADFCFPIKLSLGHFQELAERDSIDLIFYPTTLSEKQQENGMPRMLCPYVISYPSVAKETLNISKKILMPSVDFRQKQAIIINILYNYFNAHGFTFTENMIRKAYIRGINNLNQYYQERFKYGRNLLKELSDKNKTGIVCIGRPYNLYDKIVNLGLTERLKNNNMEIFPYECIIDPEENDSPVDHMYWNYGERIISAANKISEMENIYPVYFTNFSCGPDSFILSRFEEIMRGKPYLIIELDEHGSETGYLTRIEAFIDVILDNKNKKQIPVGRHKNFRKSWKSSEKKIWFPAMFEIAPRFFAAAFRAWGFDSEALPLENNEAYEMGRQNSRGSECLPASTTIGAFLKKMKEIDADPAGHALFMPTAEGPCRFGQYSMLHRSVLDKNGFHKTEIFSPTSSNSYLGMSGSLTRYLLDIIASSDIISKYIYKTRPYEINAGETDDTAEKVISEMESIIEKKGDLLESSVNAVKRLSQIGVNNIKKPLIGIVGEIYVRSNPFCNNNVIRYIERNGGEAWLSPFSEWVIYTAWMERYFAGLNKTGFLNRLGVGIKTGYMINKIHKFEDAMKEYISDRKEPHIEDVLKAGKKHIPLEFEGETILTIGRTIKFLENGASMVVNCAPFGCMPGNITTSIFQKIQKELNKPVINLFYDGESDVNKIIQIYLNNIDQYKDIPVSRLENRQLSLTNLKNCN